MSSFHNGTAVSTAMSGSASDIVGKHIPSRPVSTGINLVDESLEAEVNGEEMFTRMLRFERRRTERSGRRFVLALLESDLLKSKENDPQVNAFTCALSQSTRETDIKGWYKEGSIFGVIFTEIGGGDGNAITKVLLSKVTNALCGTRGIAGANEIRLSFHVYPDDINNSDKGPLRLTLYPDQMRNINPQRALRPAKRGLDILGNLFALICCIPYFSRLR